jgi:flagellar basal body-associated protein FliL
MSQYPPQWQQQPFPSQPPSNPNYPPYQQQQPNTNYPSNPQWPSQQPMYPQQQPPPNYQQYPQQPMPLQQPPPQKKKSRALLWIVLVVVAVLVLGCIGSVIAVTSAARNASTATISTLATSVATTSANNTPSTSGQVAKVGQTITVQDIAATLISVKTLPNDQYSPAKPGNTYIVAHVKLVNHSSAEVDYGPFDFHVKSSSGNITDGDFTSSYTGNDQLNTGKLSPGGSVEGDLIFQTGKSDHKAQLTWQPSFFGNAGDNGWLLGL